VPTEWTRQRIERWDEAARVVGDWSRDKYTAELRKRHARNRREGAELALMRYRWRLDEFAADVIVPILSRSSRISEPNELDAEVYDLPLRRWYEQRATVQKLVMTGRAIGKTTRARIRRIHAMLYGLTALSVALAKSGTDADRWIENTARWLEVSQDEGLPIAQMWPELVILAKKVSPQGTLDIRTRFGVARLRAGKWDGSLRGLNVADLRPDSIDLDDIESEENTTTGGARDKTQRKLTSKILPLGGSEPGLHVLWCQTPVHADAVAARITKGNPDLRGWDFVALPVISQWPERGDLWDELERVYFDVEAEPKQEHREQRVRELYEANRDELTRGAVVLDATRMGVLSCYLKLWQVGPSAFAREFEMKTTAATQVFYPDRWPKVHVLGTDILHARVGDGEPFALRDLPLWAHFDPSDGGDDAALVVGVLHHGRVLHVGGKVWEGAQLSQAIEDIPEALRPFWIAGLSQLHWEPPSGAASVVEGSIKAALRRAGIQLSLVRQPSKENKNQRIINTLEPLASGGLLGIRADLPPRTRVHVQGFNPARTDNRDDWLDAMQRVAHGLTVRPGRIQQWRPRSAVFG